MLQNQLTQQSYVFYFEWHIHNFMTFFNRPFGNKSISLLNFERFQDKTILNLPNFVQNDDYNFVRMNHLRLLTYAAMRIGKWHTSFEVSPKKEVQGFPDILLVKVAHIYLAIFLRKVFKHCLTLHMQ